MFEAWFQVQVSVSGLLVPHMVCLDVQDRLTELESQVLILNSISSQARKSVIVLFYSSSESRLVEGVWHRSIASLSGGILSSFSSFHDSGPIEWNRNNCSWIRDSMWE